MNHAGQAHNLDTRDLARKLDTCPTPRLAIPDLRTRWNCSRSTLNSIRKRFGLRSNGPADAHPVFDLLEILAREDIAELSAFWALGTDDDRTTLTAPRLLACPHRVVRFDCRSLVNRDDAFGRWRTVSQSAVRPDRIAVAPPLSDRVWGRAQWCEDRAIAQRVADPCIEALAVAIFPR